MKGFEIVKCWNGYKGSAYRFKNGDEPSAIVNAIDSMISALGEEDVTNYFVAMIKTDETNIWNVAQTYLASNWIKENKKPKAEDGVGSLNILSALSSEIVKLIGTDLVKNISTEVEAKINNYIADKTLVKVVEYKDERKKVEGIVHEQFDTILKFVSMNEPVMLVGPAGTGKNVIAKQVAEALNLDFYFSNAVTQEYKITGYGDANGNYVPTQFYEAFTKGGIFLLDEMDASCPEALIVLNCAIANGYFDFPVIGRVEAHPNFRVMANANTFGTGASMEYVGRNQLDGATLNRFALVEVDYDSRIEDSVCPDVEIADFCRDFRRACEKNGVHCIVSYREFSRLYKMIDIAKMDKVVALKTCLVKGLERDTLRQVAYEMKSCSYVSELKKIIEK